MLALEIAEELEAAVEQFAAIAEDDALTANRGRFSAFTFRRLRQISKIIEQHPVDEDVATAHFLQENQLGALVEELDKLEWCISVQPKNQS